ncbi:hypothetical protein HK102_007337 [Quaeritorhiza haematococci]|nr:hypothetical protein HK102_007337 [Quaeritorhiza haematococci]
MRTSFRTLFLLFLVITAVAFVAAAPTKGAEKSEKSDKDKDKDKDCETPGENADDVEELVDVLDANGLMYAPLKPSEDSLFAWDGELECGSEHFHPLELPSDELMELDPEPTNVTSSETQLEARNDRDRDRDCDDDHDHHKRHPVELIWHVMHSGVPVGTDSNLPRSVIRDAVARMNENYRAVGLTFPRVRIIRHRAPQYVSLTSEASFQEMKTTYHRGDKATLNVWSVERVITPGILGISSFPWDLATNPKLDGIVVSTTAAKMTTPTHETGHWIGLLHTFTGGCSYKNDLIRDTIPMTLYAISDCNNPIKSCHLNDFGTQEDKRRFVRSGDINVPADPIHNFMAYGPCRTEFTHDQVRKMKKLWQKYRA